MVWSSQENLIRCLQIVSYQWCNSDLSEISVTIRWTHAYCNQSFHSLYLISLYSTILTCHSGRSIQIKIAMSNLITIHYLNEPYSKLLFIPTHLTIWFFSLSKQYLMVWSSQENLIKCLKIVSYRWRIPNFLKSTNLSQIA